MHIARFARYRGCFTPQQSCLIPVDHDPGFGLGELQVDVGHLKIRALIHLSINGGINS